MKLADLDILVVGNPPPGFGGRYFIFVKLTTACGIIGWGEVYAATVGAEAMRAVISEPERSAAATTNCRLRSWGQ